MADVRSGITTIERRDDDLGEGPTPFYPATISGDGPYMVTINAGAVGFWNPVEGEDTLYFEVPTLNDTPINATPAPEISVGAGEWVCIEVKVDGRNQMRETPTIVVGEQDGTHYIPSVGDTEEEDGTYYIKLFKLDVVDETIVPDHRVWSDPILSPYLWTGSNEGGGPCRVLKDYEAADSKYRFRTIERGYGVDAIEMTDTIRSRFDAESVGDRGENVYISPPYLDDTAAAQFTKIASRYDTPQIQVTSSGDSGPIVVEGNGNMASLIFTKNGSEVKRVSWNDGLITNAVDVVVELCCSSGTAAPGP